MKLRVAAAAAAQIGVDVLQTRYWRIYLTRAFTYSCVRVMWAPGLGACQAAENSRLDLLSYHGSDTSFNVDYTHAYFP